MLAYERNLWGRMVPSRRWAQRGAIMLTAVAAAWSVGQHGRVAVSPGVSLSANPISELRRIDWSLSGVEGGIPNRTTVHSTVSAYTGTPATINTAITNAANAGGNNVVQLGVGTFSISASDILKSNVTLRGTRNGDGTIGTRINYTGTGGTTFQYNGEHPPVYFGPSSITPNFDNPQKTGFPSGQQKTWTGCGGVGGSYPRGATLLNLGSTPTGLTAGMEVLLWQTDEDPSVNLSPGTPQGSDTGLVREGFWVSTKSGSSGNPNGANWQGSYVGGEAMQQRCRVVSVVGTQVEVWPPLQHPTGSWKTGLTPMIGWQTGKIEFAGIEDCIIDANTTSGTNDLWSVVQFWFAANCWIKGCVIRGRTGQGAGSNTFGVVHLMESRNCEVKDCWFDPCAGGGQGTTTTYGVPVVCGTLHRVENCIFKNVESPLLVHASALGCVYAYNTEIHNGTHEGGSQLHETGIAYCLFESNVTLKVFGDLFHGTSFFTTAFRCYTFDTEAGFDIQALHRYWNVVGCVIGAAGPYASDCTDGDTTAPYLDPDPALTERWDGRCFRTGMPGQGATNDPSWNLEPNVGVAFDPSVKTSLLRWGNRTLFDNTTRFLSGECPTGDAFFPNEVPATEDLPDSMYLSARPAFFTHNGVSVPYPAIGPDVTGGDLGEGFVHTLPSGREYTRASANSANFKPGLYGT